MPSRSPEDAAGELVTSLRALPAEMRGAVRPALLAAAQPILADARSRASWSTRIPRAIYLRAQFTGPNPGVAIRVRRANAPHARAYEGLTRSGDRFRHPVFQTPTRNTWVERPTRRFLAPAVAEGSSRVLSELSDATLTSLRAAGWRIN
jgi:hypothetical protein